MVNIEASTPQLEVIKSLFDAWAVLDMNKIGASVSKNFTHQTFPKIADLPEGPRAEYMQKVGGILAMTTKFEITAIHEVIEAPNRVVIHASCVFSTADGTRLDYDTVCIFSLVEEDGELKILEIRDFCDPQKRAPLLAEIAKVAKAAPGS